MKSSFGVCNLQQITWNFLIMVKSSYLSGKVLLTYNCVGKVINLENRSNVRDNA